MKYKEWLNEWLSCRVEPTAMEHTLKKYRAQIDKHIVPALGEYELNELSALVLQRFAAGLTAKGFAANTVNGIISTLKASLKCAVLRGQTREQHSDAVARPKIKEKTVECFTKAKQRKMVHNRKKSGQAVRYNNVIVYGTSYRRIACYYLQDVDLDNGCVP